MESRKEMIEYYKGKYKVRVLMVNSQSALVEALEDLTEEWQYGAHIKKNETFTVPIYLLEKKVRK